MTHFLWKGSDFSGKDLEGAEESASATTLRHHLHAQGVYRIKLHPLYAFSWKHPLSEAQIIDWLEQLQQLLQAHLRLTEAISLIAETRRNPLLRYRWRRMHQALNSGQAFSEALERFGGMPRWVTQLIRVAEATDRLPDVLKGLVEFYQFKREVAQERQKVASYPLLVLTSFLFITLGILLFIIPMFHRIYQRFGTDLFWGTALLQSLSNGLRGHPLLAAGVAGGIAGAGVWYHRQGEGFWRWLPGGARLVRESRLMFYSTAMNLLLRSRLNLQEALPLATELLGPQHHSLQKVREELLAGVAPAEAFRHASWASASFLRMVALADESGNLAEGFRQHSLSLRDQLKVRMNWMNALLGPLLMLGVALGVLFILLSVYLPLFRVVDYY